VSKDRHLACHVTTSCLANAFWKSRDEACRACRTPRRDTLVTTRRIYTCRVIYCLVSCDMTRRAKWNLGFCWLTARTTKWYWNKSAKTKR